MRDNPRIQARVALADPVVARAAAPVVDGVDPEVSPAAVEEVVGSEERRVADRVEEEDWLVSR